MLLDIYICSCHDKLPSATYTYVCFYICIYIYIYMYIGLLGGGVGI